MLKSDLIQNVATALGETTSKSAAQNIVEVVLNEIAKGVKADGEARIAGFGTFKKKERPARMGPKPGSPGEKIPYAAKTTVTFKAGKELQTAVS